MGSEKYIEVSNIEEVEENSRNDKKFEIRLYQQIVSAGAGSLLTSVFVTPLDVVKIRLQMQQKALASNKCYLYCNGLMDHLCPCGPDVKPLTKPPVHIKGTIDGMIQISRSEGLKSLWSGLSPTLVLAIPATVIYFVTYERLRNNISNRINLLKIKNNSKWNKFDFLSPLLSGSMARMFSAIVVSPLELIRTKMQSQKFSYPEISHIMKSMIKSEGWRSLWRGLAPSLYRDVPFSGIYWATYESFKTLFSSSHHPVIVHFFSGACSGSLAALVTVPFDVVKTHKQIEFGEKILYAKEPVRKFPKESSFDTMKMIYRTLGMRGLFAGAVPRIIKVAPACAIMIASFEYGKTFFYNYNKNKFYEKYP